MKSLTANTPYYFEIVAVDTSNDDSAPSEQITVTTLPLPAAPVNVVPTVNSSTRVTVTWTENIPTGGLPIKYYYIFRGTSPTGLANVGTRTTPEFIDTTVSPDTTYYYAIEAIDTSLNVSPMSATEHVTTPATPAAPVNVVPTANSATKVTVTWSENIPANGLPIKYYYIFRGTSPTALTNVATRTTAEYIDDTVSASTTYYYAIEALDTDMDVSPQSAPPAEVTTP